MDMRQYREEEEELNDLLNVLPEKMRDRAKWTSTNIWHPIDFIMRPFFFVVGIVAIIFYILDFIFSLCGSSDS